MITLDRVLVLIDRCHNTTNSCSVNIYVFFFIPGNFGNVSRQILSPPGEEAYEGLIYLNNSYQRAIIGSRGHKESLWDIENSLYGLCTSHLFPPLAHPRDIAGEFANKRC